jgi:hexosaminidase
LQARRRLFRQNIVPWKFHPRHSDFEPPVYAKKFVRNIQITLKQQDPVNISRAGPGVVDESYYIFLGADGSLNLTANSSYGIVRSLSTLTQLFYQHSRGGVYSPVAPVEIRDSPRFSHRGLNLDVARAYYPIKDLKRTIDALGFNKMNRLHLHITDSQSWPLVIPSIPALASKGSYHRSMVYTPGELDDLQKYGALQGVQVYLEIDMPGHTAAISYGDPSLIAGFQLTPQWGTYAGEPPTGTLKLNSTRVYGFINTLMKDLLPRVFNYSGVFHTGGDEVNTRVYELDDTVNSTDIAVLNPLIQRLTSLAHAHISRANFTPMVWEEMLFDYKANLTKDVIVQAWRSQQAVARSVSEGYRTIAGTADYWVSQLEAEALETNEAGTVS